MHRAASSTGRARHFFYEKNFELDISQPVSGDPLPITLTEHDGVIIFCGPMSINDNSDYLARERALIEVALKEKTPFLVFASALNYLQKL